MPRTALSILVPTYKRACPELLQALAQQAESIAGLHYEIILAEDGTPRAADAKQDGGALEANAATCLRLGARHLVLPHNTGRAAIRNRLAREARYPHLLFIDSGALPSTATFVANYAAALESAEVVCGGVRVAKPQADGAVTLRYRYEKQWERRSAVAYRAAHPYASFRTTAFACQRKLLLEMPFDESLPGYGYEDVLFGRTLQQRGIAICHIDAPATYRCLDSNALFLEKSEEALRTLRFIGARAAGYSSLYALATWLQRLHIARPLRPLLHAMQPRLRRRLIKASSAQSRFALQRLALYRLIYFLTLSHGKQRGH